MKALIQETHGQAVETQKLIAYGKVMEEESKTVSDYKIVENGFIVMMTVKVSSPLVPNARSGACEAHRTSKVLEGREIAIFSGAVDRATQTLFVSSNLTASFNRRNP